MVVKYMTYTDYPFIGYRVKKQFKHLLPTCEGRPKLYSMSALYLIESVRGYNEAHSKLFEFTDYDKKYPGTHPIGF